MAQREGRCTNDLYCSLASAKQAVQVPAAGKFVCPQCGKPLAEPVAEKGGVSKVVLIGAAGLLASAGALFAAGAMIGGPPKPQPAPGPKTPVAVVENDAAAPPRENAQTAATPPQSVAAVPPPPVHSAPSPVSGSAWLQSPASVTPPSPAHNPATSPQTATSMPQLTNPRSRPGGVQPALVPPRAPLALAMLQNPAPRQNDAPTQAAQERARQQADQTRRIEAAQQAERQKKQILAQQQEEKRKQLFLAQQAREEEAQAKADAADRAAQQARNLEAAQQARDQAAAQQARDQEAARQTAAAEVERKRQEEAKAGAAAKAAGVPVGITRGFSSRAVAGGSPIYPSAYEGEGRIGHVTVSCLINGSGTPSGCRVVSAQGGIGFNNSAIKWLRSGQVRFAPIMRNGQPQTEEHTFGMTFEP